MTVVCIELPLCSSDKGGRKRAIERVIGYLKDWKTRGSP